MLAALVIVFREMIEAGLIVGIALAATRGVPGRSFWVASGIAAGVLGAFIVALCAEMIASLMDGIGQEIFNASVLSIAIVMLTWHILWMQREGRRIAHDMRHFGHDIALGRRPLWALAAVIAVAVLREGAEVVLFLYGITLSGGSPFSAMMIGGILGIILGGMLSLSMYWGLIRIPTRYFFVITTWMIILLAAGMASQAISFLQQAGVITAFSDHVWDTSFLLSEKSLLGTTLHTLIGYTAQPTGMQLIAFVGTLSIIALALRLLSAPPHHASKKRISP